MNSNFINEKNFKIFGSEEMNEIAKNIRIVVFDFDGVFTDNSVYTTEDGKEIIKNSKYDSMGISKANRRQNFELEKVPYIVFSSETNQTVSARNYERRKQGLSNLCWIIDSILGEGHCKRAWAK